jgi:hypothetical protein
MSGRTPEAATTTSPSTAVSPLAITARGRPGAVAGPDQRPGRADLVVVLVVAAILAAGLVI